MKLRFFHCFIFHTKSCKTGAHAVIASSGAIHGLPKATPIKLLSNNLYFCCYNCQNK